MNISFTIYETLRRLLILGVGVGVLGFVLAPPQDTADFAAVEQDTPAMETAVTDAVEPVEPVQQKTLI